MSFIALSLFNLRACFFARKRGKWGGKVAAGTGEKKWEELGRKAVRVVKVSEQNYLSRIEWRYIFFSLLLTLSLYLSLFLLSFRQKLKINFKNFQIPLPPFLLFPPSLLFLFAFTYHKFFFLLLPPLPPFSYLSPPTFLPESRFYFTIPNLLHASSTSSFSYAPRLFHADHHPPPPPPLPPPSIIILPVV